MKVKKITACLLVFMLSFISVFSYFQITRKVQASSRYNIVKVYSSNVIQLDDGYIYRVDYKDTDGIVLAKVEEGYDYFYFDHTIYCRPSDDKTDKIHHVTYNPLDDANMIESYDYLLYDSLQSRFNIAPSSVITDCGMVKSISYVIAKDINGISKIYWQKDNIKGSYSYLKDEVMQGDVSIIGEFNSRIETNLVKPYFIIRVENNPNESLNGDYWLYDSGFCLKGIVPAGSENYIKIFKGHSSPAVKNFHEYDSYKIVSVNKEILVKCVTEDTTVYRSVDTSVQVTNQTSINIDNTVIASNGVVSFTKPLLKSDKLLGVDSFVLEQNGNNIIQKPVDSTKLPSVLNFNPITALADIKWRINKNSELEIGTIYGNGEYGYKFIKDSTSPVVDMFKQSGVYMQVDDGELTACSLFGNFPFYTKKINILNSNREVIYTINCKDNQKPSITYKYSATSHKVYIDSIYDVYIPEDTTMVFKTGTAKELGYIPAMKSIDTLELDGDKLKYVENDKVEFDLVFADNSKQSFSINLEYPDFYCILQADPKYEQDASGYTKNYYSILLKNNGEINNICKILVDGKLDKEINLGNCTEKKIFVSDEFFDAFEKNHTIEVFINNKSVLKEEVSRSNYLEGLYDTFLVKSDGTFDFRVFGSQAKGEYEYSVDKEDWFDLCNIRESEKYYDDTCYSVSVTITYPFTDDTVLYIRKKDTTSIVAKAIPQTSTNNSIDILTMTDTEITAGILGQGFPEDSIYYRVKGTSEWKSYGYEGITFDTGVPTGYTIIEFSKDQNKVWKSTAFIRRDYEPIVKSWKNGVLIFDLKDITVLPSSFEVPVSFDTADYVQGGSSTTGFTINHGYAYFLNDKYTLSDNVQQSTDLKMSLLRSDNNFTIAQVFYNRLGKRKLDINIMDETDFILPDHTYTPDVKVLSSAGEYYVIFNTPVGNSFDEITCETSQGIQRKYAENAYTIHNKFPKENLDNTMSYVVCDGNVQDHLKVTVPWSHPNGTYIFDDDITMNNLDAKAVVEEATTEDGTKQGYYHLKMSVNTEALGSSWFYEIDNGMEIKVSDSTSYLTLSPGEHTVSLYADDTNHQLIYTDTVDIPYPETDCFELVGAKLYNNGNVTFLATIDNSNWIALPPNNYIGIDTTENEVTLTVSYMGIKKKVGTISIPSTEVFPYVYDAEKNENNLYAKVYLGCLDGTFDSEAITYSYNYFTADGEEKWTPQAEYSGAFYPRAGSVKFRIYNNDELVKEYTSPLIFRDYTYVEGNVIFDKANITGIKSNNNKVTLNCDSDDTIYYFDGTKWKNYYKPFSWDGDTIQVKVRYSEPQTITLDSKTYTQEKVFIPTNDYTIMAILNNKCSLYNTAGLPIFSSVNMSNEYPYLQFAGLNAEETNVTYISASLQAIGLNLSTGDSYVIDDLTNGNTVIDYSVLANNIISVKYDNGECVVFCEYSPDNTPSYAIEAIPYEDWGNQCYWYKLENGIFYNPSYGELDSSVKDLYSFNYKRDSNIYSTIVAKLQNDSYAIYDTAESALITIPDSVIVDVENQVFRYSDKTYYRIWSQESQIIENDDNLYGWELTDDVTKVKDRIEYSEKLPTELQIDDLQDYMVTEHGYFLCKNDIISFIPKDNLKSSTKPEVQLDATITKDESNIDINVVTINVDAEDGTTIKAPNGQVYNNSCEYSVSENGVYAFILTKGDIEEVRSVSIENIFNRLTDAPQVTCNNGKISLNSSHDIEISTDNGTTWVPYVGEFQYTTPVLAHAMVKGQPCDDISITLEGSKLHVQNTHENVIKNEIFQNGIGGSDRLYQYKEYEYSDPTYKDVINGLTLTKYSHEILDNSSGLYAHTKASLGYRSYEAYSDYVSRDEYYTATNSELTYFDSRCRLIRFGKNDVLSSYTGSRDAVMGNNTVIVNKYGKIRSNLPIQKECDKLLGDVIFSKVIGDDSSYFLLTTDGRIILYYANPSDTTIDGTSDDRCIVLPGNHYVDLDENCIATIVNSDGTTYTKSILASDSTNAFIDSIAKDYDKVLAASRLLLKDGSLYTISLDNDISNVFCSDDVRFADIAEYRSGQITDIYDKRYGLYVGYTGYGQDSQALRNCLQVATIALAEDGWIYTVKDGVATKTDKRIDYFPAIINYDIEETNWTRNDVPVALDIKAENGVANIQFAKLNTTDTQFSNTVETNGQYEVIVTDTKGLVSTDIITVTNIDKLKPIIKSLKVQNGTLKVDASDAEATQDYAESGISHYEYSYNKEQWLPLTNRLMFKGEFDTEVGFEIEIPEEEPIMQTFSLMRRAASIDTGISALALTALNDNEGEERTTYIRAIDNAGNYSSTATVKAREGMNVTTTLDLDYTPIYENGKTTINFWEIGDSDYSNNYTYNHALIQNGVTGSDESGYTFSRTFDCKELLKVASTDAFAQKEIDIKVISSEAPIITNNKAQVAISPGAITNDTLGKLYYRVDATTSTPWKEYNGEFTLTPGTHTVESYQTTRSYNISSSVTSKQIIIQSDLSLEHSEKYENGKTTVTFNEVDDPLYNHNYDYAYDNKPGHQFSVTEDTIVNIKVEDPLTRSTAQEPLPVKVIKVDKPNIICDTIGNTTIEAGKIVNDTLDKIYYKVDDSEWKIYDKPFILEEGTHTIKSYQISKQYQIKSDEAVKEVTITKPKDDTKAVINYREYYSLGSTKVIFYADYDINHDGIFDYSYVKENSSEKNGYAFDETVHDTKYQLKAKSTSKEGTLDMKVRVIYIDKPAIELQNNSNMVITHGKVQNDTVLRTEYKLDKDTTWHTYSDVKALAEGKHTVTARTISTEGVVGPENTVTLTVKKADKEIKAPTFTQDNEIVTIKDGECINTVVDYTEYRIDTNTEWQKGNKVEFTKGGTYTITARTVDKEGTVGPEATQTFVVDLDGPIIKYTYTPMNLTNQDVIVTITAEDESGVKEMIVDGKTSDEPTKYVKTMVENGIIHVTATDTLGNKSSKDIEITNIDKEPPVIKLLANSHKKVKFTGTDNVTETKRINFSYLVGEATINDFDSAISGTTFTPDENEDTYTLFAKDEAGNITVRVIHISSLFILPETGAAQIPFIFIGATTLLGAIVLCIKKRKKGKLDA